MTLQATRSQYQVPSNQHLAPCSTQQAIFFIDPKGIIRAVIYYPVSLGRNFEEIYRALIAMKTADAFSVATPADWQPGDDVIVPTAGSCGVAKQRMEMVGRLSFYKY